MKAFLSIALGLAVLASDPICGAMAVSQHYWKCWNEESTFAQRYGPSPHPSYRNPAEHDCTDEELKKSKFKQDNSEEAKKTGGWLAPPNPTAP